MVNSKIEEIEARMEQDRLERELRWDRVQQILTLICFLIFASFGVGITYWVYVSGYVIWALFTAAVLIYILVRMLVASPTKSKRFLDQFKNVTVKSEIMIVVWGIICIFIANMIFTWLYF